MNVLVKTVKQLQNSKVSKIVNNRLEEFKQLNSKSNEEWFGELCFCLLTANSKASTALKIQQDLGFTGFCNACADRVKKCIVENKHRFHNRKTEYIIGAREFLNIKDRISEFDSSFQAREWLVKNVKGLGFKEASHFLRNVGFTDVAILDRHILRLLHEYGYIKEVPNSLTKNKYYKIEKVLEKIGRETGLNQAELDLYLWYEKTGKVLK